MQSLVAVRMVPFLGIGLSKIFRAFDVNVPLCTTTAARRRPSGWWRMELETSEGTKSDWEPVFESRSQNNSYTPAPFFPGALRAPIFKEKRAPKKIRRASRAFFEMVFSVSHRKRVKIFRARHARPGFFPSPPEIIKCVSCTVVVDSNTAGSVSRKSEHVCTRVISILERDLRPF